MSHVPCFTLKRRSIFKKTARNFPMLGQKKASVETFFTENISGTLMKKRPCWAENKSVKKSDLAILFRRQKKIFLEIYFLLHELKNQIKNSGILCGNLIEKMLKTSRFFLKKERNSKAEDKYSAIST